MGYDPARVSTLTPRQIVAFITSRYRAEYQAWRNAGFITVVLRRINGDKHADFDKMFPMWEERGKSAEDKRALNLKRAKALAARREKAAQAALERARQNARQTS